MAVPTANFLTFPVNNAFKNHLLIYEKCSVEIDWFSSQQHHSLDIFLTDNKKNITKIQQKYFSTENVTKT